MVGALFVVPLFVVRVAADIGCEVAPGEVGGDELIFFTARLSFSFV